MGKRHFRVRRWPFAGAALLLANGVLSGLAAQSTGGVLFSYLPHAGHRTGFEDGYRSHLEWHRAQADSLAWYGWDVIAGRRIGQFVDGTFGISFEAMDRRVDPAGDAAHARSSFAEHAVATGSWAVRARDDLSTSLPLEERAPPVLAQVVTYTVEPSRRASFEAVLRAVRRSASESGLLPYTVYETLVGSVAGELVVMVWRGGMAGFDRSAADPVVAIRDAAAAAGTALRAESELWRLRTDLTLVPERGADPTLEPPDASEWRTIAPGGETTCAFGDPFEFWVRDGSSTDLLVYLQGGGACWSHGSCDPAGDIQFDSAITGDDHAQRTSGIFDRTRPDNPFARSGVVFVPYCTGDFHLGTRHVTYAAPPGSARASVSVRHAGFRNLTAVLDHLSRRFATPRRITVVGASAGAVASPVVAALLARRFPDAIVRQLGDGAAGLRFAGSGDLLEAWGAREALDAVGFLVPDTADAFTALYVQAARLQPGIRFSQVATNADARVADGLRRMGEDPASLPARIAASYRELVAAGLCFSGWVLPGSEHTIVWRASFFDVSVDGTPLPGILEREVLQRECPA